MTEKRFTFTQDTLAKADVFDGSEFVCCTLSVWVEQLVDLLNQLNDENEQLKSIIDKLTLDNTKMKKVLNTTKKENEKLKHEIEDFQELLALKEQKEFLKPIIQQIEEARERERTNLGKSVLQQLLEQLQ